MTMVEKESDSIQQIINQGAHITGRSVYMCPICRSSLGYSRGSSLFEQLRCPIHGWLSREVCRSPELSYMPRKDPYKPFSLYNWLKNYITNQQGNSHASTKAS